MKARTCLAGCIVAVTAAAAQFPTPKPDVEVARAYHADGLSVEGAGVCSITSETVDCWNMDGAHDQALTDQVRIHYLAGYNNEVSLRFGKKNRFLVLRRGPNQGLQYMSPSGQFMQATNNQPSSDGEALDWVRVEPAPTDASASVVVNFFNLPGDPPVDIPFAHGQKTKVGGVELEIGAFQKVTGPRYPGYFDGSPGQKQWSIVIGFSSQDQSFQASFTALDRNGTLIGYVDHDGKVVSGLKYLEETQRHQPPPGYFPGNQPNGMYGNAVVQQMGASVTGAFTLLTNIDPSQIGTLRVVTSHQRRVLITGFPLDPKP